MGNMNIIKIKGQILFAFTGILITCGWAGQSDKPIQKAGWLIGTWENKTQRGSMYETWTKMNEEEIHGKSYILKEKDTVVFETIRLLQEKNNLFYIPVVKDQNNNRPVRFSSKLISPDKLVFENPGHDFPQMISYTRIGMDSLVAEISGTKNGKERTIIFPMKRLK